ncbi:sugar phosphate isomerase/epimerase family protein [Paenibacillus ferrarius]|uniref:sugar phosphate isomerase/epimerase family protein n=1 Tax=Paenibacillus ferrarius TaxID=1469647 RepID=UPI003D28DF3D
MSYLSVSTWSLHRLLGPLRWTVWNPETRMHEVKEQDQPQILSLLELPQEAARRGYQALELCHFHFPSTDDGYLHDLRERFAAAQISLDTILLDYGDLTHPDDVRRAADYAFMQEWIGLAAKCGAKRIRIIAGEASPSDEASLQLSTNSLRSLGEYGERIGVQVVTENFKSLLSTGANCLTVMDQTAGQVAMITDFGNYHGPLKYEEIAATTPYSKSIHVKPHYDEAGRPDEAELRQCLDSVQAGGYDGAYVLIYDGPGDMWEGLERVRKMVEPYLGAAPGSHL